MQSMVDLSKCTFNKKIFSGILAISYNPNLVIYVFNYNFFVVDKIFLLMVTCIMSSHFDAKNTVIEDLDKTKIKSTLKAFLV